MNWYVEPDNTVYIFIGLFILIYLLYIVRVSVISRKMGVPYYGIAFKVILRTVYFSLFIIALLGPSFGQAKDEIQAVGKDIYFCVDLSESMNANDIEPTRLSNLKHELVEIVNAFSGDRMSLIIFSGEAFIQCPLTYDQSALSLYIETLSTSLVPETGTNFGPPLEMAISKMNENEDVAGKETNKVIVLMSDGEDFGEKTNEAVKKIKDEDISLYTLGIGTRQGSRIPQGSSYKADKQGQPVITKLNPEDLISLADETGGKYYEISDQKNETDQLIRDIREVEGQIQATRVIDVNQNKYWIFLAIAMGLFILDMLVPVKTLQLK
ncbi:vWA domain-containing protein [Marinigracilibium pacificum]|uniref:VWA domain-containing protein n=1 Tax=Marinigracilibium pacificum TaxID=2729599 RepID=A0A848J5E7_9BACT|nr:VWA domain-containing protein [Marinigracilibium pacificum]NMM48372.1 VWA domain-containing protein [Marinigracilibium pacificum]